MRSSPRVLLLLAATLVATAAHAQYGTTPIKHVIVIFQGTSSTSVRPHRPTKRFRLR